MLLATPEDRYATPLGVATPSLGSPDLNYTQNVNELPNFINFR